MRSNTYIVEGDAALDMLRPFLRPGDAVAGVGPARADVIRLERVPAARAADERCGDVRVVVVTSLDDLAWAYAHYEDLEAGRDRLLVAVDDAGVLNVAQALDVPFAIAPEVVHGSQAAYRALRQLCRVRHVRHEVQPFGDMILAMLRGAPLLASEFTVREGGWVYGCGRRLGHIREGDVALKRRALTENACVGLCEYVPFCPCRSGPEGCVLRERAFPFLEGFLAATVGPGEASGGAEPPLTMEADSGAVTLNLENGGRLDDVGPYLRLGDSVVTRQGGGRRVRVVTLEGLEEVPLPYDESHQPVPSPDPDVVDLLAQGQDLRCLFLRHPATSFVVETGGDLYRIDGHERIGNLMEEGIPGREAVDDIVADDLLAGERCSFCEHRPLCGGLLRERGCDEHLAGLERLREALIRRLGPRAATVFCSFKCVNNCIFCAPAPKRRHRPLDREEVLGFIDRACREGCDSISFSGAGEPTLHPDDLVEYASRALRGGVRRITVFTNGAGLNEELLGRLVKAGVTGFLVSLHGNEESHDLNVRRRGSYAEAVAAIRRVTAAKLGLTVNSCVTRHNLDHLAQVLDEVRSMSPGVRHVLAFPEISGNARENLDLIPSLRETAGAVMELFRQGRTFWIEGLPLCLVRGFPRDRVARKRRGNILYKDNLGEEYRLDAVFPPACEACGERRECDGLDSGYFHLRGGMNEIGLD